LCRAMRPRHHARSSARPTPSTPSLQQSRWVRLTRGPDGASHGNALQPKLRAAGSRAVHKEQSATGDWQARRCRPAPPQTRTCAPVTLSAVRTGNTDGRGLPAPAPRLDEGDDRRRQARACGLTSAAPRRRPARRTGGWARQTPGRRRRRGGCTGTPQSPCGLMRSNEAGGHVMAGRTVGGLLLWRHLARYAQAAGLGRACHAAGR
jgi:hypothetical protein